jgi:hypothetical protein
MTINYFSFNKLIAFIEWPQTCGIAASSRNQCLLSNYQPSGGYRRNRR